eukprot:591497-Lingulodinium_polyedra.AAC.1
MKELEELRAKRRKPLEECQEEVGQLPHDDYALVRPGDQLPGPVQTARGFRGHQEGGQPWADH